MGFDINKNTKNNRTSSDLKDKIIPCYPLDLKGSCYFWCF